jgi:uncharacterized protein
MSAVATRAYAFNSTRQAYLAERLALANTHYSRLVGLIGRTSNDFSAGMGLWIKPCRGVHTLGMRFPIDVIYLDRQNTVVHMEQNLRPWRVARVCMKAASVLELPSATVSETKTSVGDEIKIAFDENGAEG